METSRAFIPMGGGVHTARPDRGLGASPKSQDNPRTGIIGFLSRVCNVSVEPSHTRVAFVAFFVLPGSWTFETVTSDQSPLERFLSLSSLDKCWDAEW